MSARAIVVILDGAGASDYDDISSVRRAEVIYRRSHTPAGFAADSLCCIGSMLGCPPADIPRGRAYLEALAEGLTVYPDDLVFRVNGVGISDDILRSSAVSRTAPQMPSNYLFHPMGAHKNLLLLRGGRALEEHILTYPPHENLGMPIDAILPQCEDSALQAELRGLIECGFWAWGQASAAHMPSFLGLHGETAAMVAATEIVRGISAAMDIPSPKISGATAETDTDLAAKLESALSLAEQSDIVFVHINGADEAAHRRDREEKRAFLRRCDRELLVPLADRLKKTSALIITSDHATLAESGAHSSEAVSTYIINPNEESFKWQRYL